MRVGCRLSGGVYGARAGLFPREGNKIPLAFLCRANSRNRGRASSSFSCACAREGQEFYGRLWWSKGGYFVTAFSGANVCRGFVNGEVFRNKRFCSTRFPTSLGVPAEDNRKMAGFAPAILVFGKMREKPNKFGCF